MRPRFNSDPRRPKHAYAGGKTQKAIPPNNNQGNPKKPFPASTQAQPHMGNNGGQGKPTNFPPNAPQMGNSSQGNPTNGFANSGQMQAQMGNSSQGNSANVFPNSQMGNNRQGNPTNGFANASQMQPQMGKSIQGNPTNAFPNSQMGNNCQGNPTNVFPNPGQMQSQMGMMNPQAPFNQSNTQFNNMPNRPPGNLVLQQNGMPFMGGFMPGMNAMLQPNQFFANNSMNMPQFFNPNPVLPNGQLCFQSPMQNMNQFAQMSMPGFTQGPCNIPIFPNQVPQNNLVNPQLGMMQYNAIMQSGNQAQNNLVRPAVDANGSGQAQNTSQAYQGNPPLQHPSCSAPAQQTQNDFRPPGFNVLQGNQRDGGNNNSHANWKNSPNNKYGNNSQRHSSQGGFMKNHNIQNANGKSGFHNKRGRKGQRNDSGNDFQHTNSPNQKPVQQKRTFVLNYTEQEIQQWREARRKNHPSKVNAEKKLEENATETEDTDTRAKLRRQQLKEVLAKQAELGVEVAEIPSSYLSDSENKVHHEKDETKKACTKKEKFQNKSNKRGRSRQKDRSKKKQKLAAGDDDSSSLGPHQDEELLKKRPVNKRPPTLLQKLLSSEIKRDSSHLLQAFRFMGMNSFFKDLPEKPLRFPTVVVKETDNNGATVERHNGCSEKSLVSEIKGNALVEESVLGHRSSDFNADVKAVHFGGNVGEPTQEPEEEEGEIID